MTAKLLKFSLPKPDKEMTVERFLRMIVAEQKKTKYFNQALVLLGHSDEGGNAYFYTNMTPAEARSAAGDFQIESYLDERNEGEE